MPFSFLGMTPEMWEALASMEGIPVIEANRECCVCGDEIDKNLMHIIFMDLTASAHISCIDNMLAELEERIYNR